MPRRRSFKLAPGPAGDTVTGRFKVQVVPALFGRDWAFSTQGVTVVHARTIDESGVCHGEAPMTLEYVADSFWSESSNYKVGP